MCSRPRSRPGLRAPRRGAAALEFAVVGSAFFFLVLGIVEVGRGMMAKQAMIAATRQGCRAGILPGNGTTEVKTAVKSSLSAAGITATDSDITVLVNDASGDPSTASTGDEITVKVSLTVSKFTWVPGGQFLSGSIQGQYTLRKQ